MQWLALAALLLPLNFYQATVLDSDNDGLSDQAEVEIYHSDADNPDTDADGYLDGEEIANGYSPLTTAATKLTELDSDNDGLSDDLEIKLGTDLLNPDTDGDTYLDGQEVAYGYNPTISGDNRDWPRRAEIDLTTQRLSYFFNDIKIGEMPVSTGLISTPTPTGNFKILAKKPTVHYQGTGYNFPNTKWNLMFKKGYWGNYYLHGAYWHDQFGLKPMSHGCINIAYADAEKLYHFMAVGDEVKIYGLTPKKVVKQ